MDSHGELPGSHDSNCRPISALCGESHGGQSYFVKSGVERFDAESGSLKRAKYDSGRHDCEWRLFPYA